MKLPIEALKRMAREPLLQFLAAGGLLMLSGAWWGASATGDGTVRSVIDITEARRIALRAGFSATRERSPTPAEEQALIEDYVTVESLYREARRLGLDASDQVVRRWLAQKMRFLLENTVVVEAPDDAEAAAYLARNRARLRPAPRMRISHMFFTSQTQADEARARLDGHAPTQALPLPFGEFFPEGPHLPPMTARRITDLFGRAFAAGIEALPREQWSAPVASSFGWHLVWVHEEAQPRTDESTLLARAREELLRERQDAANARAIERLRERYEVRLHGVDTGTGP